ncbi:methylthioribulose 1-phosphate dehydratase [endosymbiont of Riftia pachyptila]|nr:methylthioribulose 1-phosphate dehydratase [endosymbiont of Riftia pachyptila]
MPSDFETIARELIEIGHLFHQRGWVPATSGNFSARLDDGSLAITASGRHKGRLDLEDILHTDADGNTDELQRPSDESLLHILLYQRLPEINAVLHPHTVNATLLSRLHQTHLSLQDYELLKTFAGIDSHDCQVRVPIFANDQDIARLANRVDRYIDANPDLVGFLIQGHGFYTWGESIDEAIRHVEAFEFMFECEMRLLSVRSS